MGKLLAAMMIAALGWGGFWFIGAAAVERGLAAWFDDLRGRGWSVAYGGLNTAGFPNRFDTTITELNLSDPRSGIGWHAPLFQILALSYRPNHIIAVLPHDQTITTPRETIDIASTRMRGSVVFEPGTDLTLDHTAFVTEDMTLTGDTGWSAALAEARLATRRSAGRDNAHDVAFEAFGLSPTADLRELLDPGARLPETLKAMKIDAVLTFDSPWNRFAVAQKRPNLMSIDLETARATWGPIDLRAEGSLSIDGNGMPTGRITLGARNWRQMLAMAVGGGIVPDAMAPLIERGLALIADDADTLDAPLTFADGQVSLGPVPLGAAPRIGWR